MTEVATAALAGLSVAEATPQTAANHGMPPGRVRHMFKTLDTDGNGTLSSEELKTGFAKEFKVDALAPHVRRRGSNHPTLVAAPPRVHPSSFARNMLHRPVTAAFLHPLHPAFSANSAPSAPIAAAQVVARMDEMFSQHADEKDGEKAP